LGELKALRPQTWINAPKWVLHFFGEIIPSKRRMKDAVNELRNEYRKENKEKSEERKEERL
jgi:hypothetical protein